MIIQDIKTGKRCCLLNSHVNQVIKVVIAIPETKKFGGFAFESLYDANYHSEV